MSEKRYTPKNWFLFWDPSARKYLTTLEVSRLITLMSDKHPANRDWAALFLAASGNDSKPIRDAFYNLALGVHEDAAAEARIGLASRKDKRALGLVRKALCREQFGEMDVWAAGIIGHASLVLPLQKYARGWFDDNVVDAAIASCKSGGKVQPFFSYWEGRRVYP